MLSKHKATKKVPCKASVKCTDEIKKDHDSDEHKMIKYFLNKNILSFDKVYRDFKALSRSLFYMATAFWCVVFIEHSGVHLFFFFLMRRFCLADGNIPFFTVLRHMFFVGQMDVHLKKML